jgi:hypothetical protein
LGEAPGTARGLAALCPPFWAPSPARAGRTLRIPAPTLILAGELDADHDRRPPRALIREFILAD